MNPKMHDSITEELANEECRRGCRLKQMATKWIGSAFQTVAIQQNPGKVFASRDMNHPDSQQHG